MVPNVCFPNVCFESPTFIYFLHLFTMFFFGVSHMNKGRDYIPSEFHEIFLWLFRLFPFWNHHLYSRVITVLSLNYIISWLVIERYIAFQNPMISHDIHFLISPLYQYMAYAMKSPGTPLELSAFPGTRGLRRRQCRLVTTDAPSDALASRDLGGAVAVELWGRPSWDGLLGIFMANNIYIIIYIWVQVNKL